MEVRTLLLAGLSALVPVLSASAKPPAKAKAAPAAKESAPAVKEAPVVKPEAPAKPTPSVPGLPEFTLPDLDGKMHSSREFAGKPVVVDFWATWCAACKESVPHLAGLQEKYGSRGLTVLGISVDKGSAEKIRKAAKKLGINYLVLHDKDNTLAPAFGFTGIPSLYVYGRSGGLMTALPGYDAGQEDRLTALTLDALGN